MHQGRIRLFITAVLVTAGLAYAPGGTNQTVFADCHEHPSFVTVKNFYTGGTLNSSSPGNTITLNHWNGNLRVYHGGDVMPETRAHFNYINTANGALRYEFATDESQSNGVIHHEWEFLDIAVPPGTQLAVYGYWMDECGAGQQVAIFLGHINVNP